MKPWTKRTPRTPKLAVVGTAGHNNRWPKQAIRGSGRMYAICFDLDQEALKRHYPAPTHTNGYDDIRRVLEKYGFSRRQGSVYFGDEHVTPVTCFMAVQAVQQSYPWFARTVSDIRMLRIEENNDLMPVIAEQELDLGPPVSNPGVAAE